MNKSNLSLVILLLALLVLLPAAAVAQQSADRLLTPGAAVSGTLDGGQVIQVYVINSPGPQTVTLSVNSEPDEAVLLAVTDAAGDPIVGSGDYVLPSAGTYYVTVLPNGALPEDGVRFDLELSAAPGATFTAPGSLLTVTGLQVSLSWDSVANLDLEVRDPVGGSLFWETPTIPSGGRFSQNANADCTTRTAETPTEQATWASGVVPTGSYEILVYYQQQTACPTTDLANLTLNITVDGVAAEPIQAQLPSDRIYLASFVVNDDGAVTLGSHGVKIDPPVADGISLSNPIQLTPNFPADGAVTSVAPTQAYQFSGVSGDFVSLQMEALSGNLDTLLLLLDPSGNLVAFNDDRIRGDTNSLIENYRLLVDGDYTLIATRYGQDIGGTQGEYRLALLSGAVASTANVAAPVFENVPRGAVEVSLQWSTGADLQLLARDPFGEAVFDDRTSITSGGQLAAAGNANCIPAVTGSPLSYIYWPEGQLPTAGAYEIEVWYQNTCNDTRPVSFTLTAVANGNVVLAQNAIIRPNERYVTSYVIGLDGTVTGGEGGIFGTGQRPDVASVDLTGEIDTAPVLAAEQVVTGAIRLNRKFDVYVFDAEVGQVVTVSMEQLNGTLDPVLFLLDSNGVQVAQNDDAAADTRNSLISYTVQTAGQHVIVATHFGGRYGVTAGDYRLSLRLN